MKIINFDMDGTLADFYGVEKWLQYLHEENTTPYEVAQSLVDEVELAHLLTLLQKRGYEINIISWGAKDSTPKFFKRTTKAKKKWLKKHFKVKFNNIFVVPFGTPKDSIKRGILFDDNDYIRQKYDGLAFSEKNIMQVLRMLLSEEGL